MREIEGHGIPPVSFFWVNYLRLNLKFPNHSTMRCLKLLSFSYKESHLLLDITL